ncbi:hypothetical protein SAY86_009748 [Trapa natans]|uniref:Clp R domain-containing protein n=1 Tax=Trapa natans TaxID=22666 RepID=A0AAN7QT44_TRANT|nr:hypothetical protein SAY86_009748 [Trapa natans]
MRTGICSIQQTLTVEALAIVKQAVSFARRRGHAQVTPLHVAASMLASSTGLLRKACLQCHSHPLQYKALELCFNVALNRLPASTPSPLLAPANSSHPSLSNALVAAFKRAQAHQRRGSSESQQQQPILALKIEIEQLVISILDDPSVSRVMREAGFSSTLVKSRVEQAISMEGPPQRLSKSDGSVEHLPDKESAVIAAKPLSVHFPPSALENVSDDDVASVLNALQSRKRNVIIVGEGLRVLEGVVRGVAHKFERGTAPLELRSTQLISIPLFKMLSSSREELDQKLSELQGLMKNCIGRGFVLYLGNLQEVSDFWSGYLGQRRSQYYHFSNLEYLILELKKLVLDFGGYSGRTWLLGISTFQEYMKCKAGHPSLEAILDLHPLTLPAGSLSLSLNLDSSMQADCKSKDLLDVNNGLTCHKDCTLNFETDAKVIDSFKMEDSTAETSMSSSLPPWLQKCKNSQASTDHASSFLQRNLCWPSMIDFKQSPQEHRSSASDVLVINPNSTPNSASSSEAAEETNDHISSFKEYSPGEIKILSDALAVKVPWQREIILEIVETVLLCRSGKGSKNDESGERVQKEETFMLFLGADYIAKENIARELAKLVFGSQSKFISIGLSQFTHSAQDNGRKRMRDESGFRYLQRLGEAMDEDPHRVFFLEDVDQFDYISKLGIKRAMESGKISGQVGKIVPLHDAIVILCCESLSAVATREKNAWDHHQENEEKENECSAISLDLNITIHDDDGDEGDGMDQKILDCVDRKIIFKSVQEQ